MHFDNKPTLQMKTADIGIFKITNHNLHDVMMFYQFENSYSKFSVESELFNDGVLGT